MTAVLPAANRGAGMNIGFPDVCDTPFGKVIVPIPYPNFALNAMAASFSIKVRLSMMNALNLGTTIPVTFGDERGVAHWTIKGVGAYTEGNPVVFIERLPGICLTCPTTGNNMNNTAGAVLVPSATNVVYTFARAPDPLAIPAELSAAGEEVVRAAMLGGAVGCLRVRAFAPDVPARAFGALRRLLDAGMEALVIDLRQNPGGTLDAALDLAGDFVPEGTTLLTLLDADGDATPARGRCPRPHGFPLVILVDGGTASAAEVFAGSLQALGRAVVAGAPTYGKGVGQQVRGGRMEGVVRCLLPGGRALDGAGVTPDLPCVDGG